MPQMDVLIFAVQSSFLVLFIFGYLLFLKTLLPIISFHIKYENKVILDNLSWFNRTHVSLYNKPSNQLLLNIRTAARLINTLKNERHLVLNVYGCERSLTRSK